MCKNVISYKVCIGFSISQSVQNDKGVWLLRISECEVRECIGFMNMQRKELQKAFFSCGRKMPEKNAQLDTICIIAHIIVLIKRIL